MKGGASRKESHAHIFRQIADGERFFSHNAFEAFMKYARDKGFSDEQILSMASSGMSGADIFTTVDSGSSTVRSCDPRKRPLN
jgi:hypothetical protein